MRQRIAYLTLLTLVLTVLLAGPLAAQSKWDGKWTGKIAFDQDAICLTNLSVESAMVKNNELTVMIQNDKYLKKLTGKIDATGKFSGWQRLDFITTKGLTSYSPDFKFTGQFEPSSFDGSFYANFGHAKGGNVCVGTLQLALLGSLEAKAMSSGENLEVLKLKQQIAELGSNRHFSRTAANIDPTKPFDGKWLGKIAFSCSKAIKFQSAVVKNNEFTMVFRDESSLKTVTGKIDASGEFSEWQRLDFVSGGGYSQNQDFKFSGQFSAESFDGEAYANWGPKGAFCSSTLKLGREGSIHAEALLTGKDPNYLMLQRQIAAAQSAPVNDNAEARAEAKKIAKQRAAAEQRLARLLQQQKRESKRLTQLRAEADMQASQNAALRDGTPKPKTSVTANINFGNYHALVIGIDAYRELPRLKTAVADAKAVTQELKSNYGFKVTELINPTRDQMLDTMDDLQATLTYKDNLLIYYAGHGWLNEKSDQGYWLPIDAKKNRRSRWVSNSTLTDTLTALEAKHVMVVADSCYSGRLVRSANINIEGADTADYYQQMSRKKARVVITSGGLEPVEDGKGEHSPFARAFLSALSKNNSVIDGTKLFNAIRRPVMINADQTPQYSDVRRAGHDGGDFLFVRRQK